jgi:archaellum biogenesis protein FlaJ (TadC family)
MNLYGVIALIAAVGLGLLLTLGILIGSIGTVVTAHRKQEDFRQQLWFRQVMGMSVSLSACVFVVLLLLSGNSNPQPRPLDIWLDDWLWFWIAAILMLWPLSAFAWNKWQRRTRSLAGSET